MEGWSCRAVKNQGGNGRGLGQAVRQEGMLPWNEWNHSEAQIALTGPLLLHKCTIAKDAQWDLVDAKSTVQFRQTIKTFNQLNKDSQSNLSYCTKHCSGKLKRTYIKGAIYLVHESEVWVLLRYQFSRKLGNRFNAFQVKILADCFVEIGKFILNFI